MQKKNVRHFYARALLSIGAVLCLYGCLDIKEPPDDLDYSYEKVMPNETRFLTTEMNSETKLVGEWFWYKRVESEISRVSATTGAQTDNVKNWFSSEDEKTIRISKNNSAPVEEICFEGTLNVPSWDTSDYPDAYAGIGFNLCAPFPKKHFQSHFPHTLGTCDESNNALLQRFLGISFEIEYDLDDLPGRPRLVVQFRERGFQIDNKQPECRVFDEMDANVSHDDHECEPIKKLRDNRYHVEAWHVDAYNYLRDTDSDPDVGVTNLSALQAIQFQLSSRDSGRFKFCLSNIRAIYADNPRTDLKNTPPEIPDTDAFIDNDATGTKCLDDLATPQNDETNPLWVGGIDTDGQPVPLHDDSDGDFWIMKREVTAKQYDACYRANACNKPREWDACSTNKYIMLRNRLESTEGELVTAANRSANCASWYDAVNFCRWIGGQLPNQAQWEVAARSGGAKEKNKYPWVWNSNIDNNEPSCDLAIITDWKNGPGCGEKYLPVEGCTRPDGNTAGGACDMIGNLWEWVDDRFFKYDSGFLQSGDAEQTGDVGWMENYRTIKGGGFYNWHTVDEDWTILSISDSTSLEHPVEPHNPANIGFRCIRYVDDDDPCD